MFYFVLCLCDVCRGLFWVWSCLFLFCVFVMYVGVFSWSDHFVFVLCLCDVCRGLFLVWSCFISFCVFVMYVGVFSWSGHVLFCFVSL